MTPPRDVQDYEAQAREVWASCLHDGDSPSHEPIAAALRAEGRAALLAAANRFDRLADTQRPVSIMGIYEVVNLLRDYANELIAPAPESPPAKDLVAQLDELSNALASHADAETGAKWDRLRAAVGARDERMAALEAAVRWALGEEGDFPTREPGEGAYWWRTELRRRAALSRSGAASGKEPP